MTTDVKYTVSRYEHTSTSAPANGIFVDIIPPPEGWIKNIWKRYQTRYFFFIFIFLYIKKPTFTHREIAVPKYADVTPSPDAPGAEWNQGCFFNNRAPYMQSATQTGTSYANGPFLCVNFSLSATKMHH